jgi:hypothetical protein
MNDSWSSIGSRKLATGSQHRASTRTRLFSLLSSLVERIEWVEMDDGDERERERGLAGPEELK